MSDQTDILQTFAANELGTYALSQWPTFEEPPHLTHLISRLEAVERGDLKRLIVSMPPRYGKSELCSKLFPAWYLGKHPDQYIISATYGEELSVDFGRVVRNYVSAPSHREIFPACILSDDSQAAHRFTTTRGGAYYAVGRGGPITGRGAHLLVIDDPLKDLQEAESELVRKQLQEWYQAVAYTRLMPGGAVVIVTTRWHVDDLPGWLLREHGTQPWEVITFPAIAEEQDVLGREEGEPLWPAKYPLKVLEDTRDQLEARIWLALYQQKPALEGGYTFAREWLAGQFFDKWPSVRAFNRYMLVDPANTKKKKSDSTAIWVVGLGPDDNYYLLDCIKDRLPLSKRVDAVFKLHRKWRPRDVAYEQYGMQTDIEVIKQKMEADHYHFSITPVGGNVSKRDRIGKLEPLFKQHRIFMPRQLFYKDSDGFEHDLIQIFVEHEYSRYPAARHDDMLDSLARILDPGFSTIFPMSQEEREQFERPRKRGSHWAA